MPAINKPNVIAAIKKAREVDISSVFLTSGFFSGFFSAVIKESVSSGNETISWEKTSKAIEDIMRDKIICKYFLNRVSILLCVYKVANLLFLGEV